MSRSQPPPVIAAAEADPLAVSDQPSGSFAGVVSRLTSVNVVMLLAAAVTGPITARALGAEGRGELAAIIAMITIAPWLLDLGLGQWVARERARGASRADVLGAALPLALTCSLIGVALAVPLSELLGRGRSVVTTFVLIGMLLVPISVVLHMLVGLAVGESRWRLYAATRIVGCVLPVVAIVALALADQLTVASAAAAYLVGALIGGLLLLQRVRGIQRLTYDRARMRAAGAFGARSWLSQIGATAGNRLDQVLMAGLVSSRQLGLYAVAVTVASLTHGLMLAVSAALFPRVAAGEGTLAARSCRVTVVIVAAASAVVGAVTPTLVPFVFGAEFDKAVAMVVVLLVASIPLGASVVLSAALVAIDEPGAAMRAELIGLGVTIPAIVVFVPAYGGLGAAFVSLGAYVVRLVFQLRSASRAFDTPWWSFVLPTVNDVRWLSGRIRRRGFKHASPP